jgi:CrcB protein
LIGGAYAYAARANLDELVLVAITAGFLGGFTTFSSFSWQSLQLLQQGRWLYAAAYIAGSPLLGIACAGIGWLSVRRF